jgi:hypothetical protein
MTAQQERQGWAGQSGYDCRDRSVWTDGPNRSAWAGLDRTWTTGLPEHYMEDRTAGTGQTRLGTVARLPRQNSGAGHRGHLVCPINFDGQKEQNDQKMTTRT